MAGPVSIDNPDDGTAVTSPHITAQTNSDLGVDLQWEFTAGSNNSHESHHEHILDASGNKIAVRNDFANTESLAPTSTRKRAGCWSAMTLRRRMPAAGSRPTIPIHGRSARASAGRSFNS
jgi:hypothetical protein